MTAEQLIRYLQQAMVDCPECAKWHVYFNTGWTDTKVDVAVGQVHLESEAQMVRLQE